MSTRSVRYSTFNRSIRKGNLASTDRDALAFLEAAQIYNANQQRAIVNLVRSLKRVGLWSKMKAIYPFVGGTATTHKWNLKDPQDTDAAFRLSFSGGWTHSANGALPNGSNTFANTHLIPSTDLTNNNTSFGYYSRTASTQNRQDMGLILSASNLIILMLHWNGPETGSISVADSIQYSTAAGTRVQSQVTNSQGFTIGNRTSSTSHKIFKNGSQIGSTATSSSSGFFGCNIKFYIGARNNNGSIDSSLVSVSECAFATIGDGLTDTDATNLYNIVDLYQKQLGRNV